MVHECLAASSICLSPFVTICDYLFLYLSIYLSIQLGDFSGQTLIYVFDAVYLRPPDIKRARQSSVCGTFIVAGTMVVSFF